MEFKDRVSAYPNRYVMRDENGNSSYIFLERADEPISVGTPLSAETFNNMLAGLAPAVESSDYPGCYYRVVNGETEWLNPPMVDGVEYRLTKRYKGKPVYAMSLDFGALPNTGSERIAFSTSYTKVDEYLVLDVFAVKPGDDGENIHYKLPFYNSSGEVRAFYRTMGARSIWLATKSDLSAYNGRVVGEYTKE